MLKNLAAVGLVLRVLHRIRRILSAGLAVTALFSLFAASLAFAQSVSPDLLRLVTPEMLRALQQGNGSVNSSSSPTSPDIQSYRPIVPSRESATPSRLEQLYLRRSGEFLKQFGYDVLGAPSAVSINQSGGSTDLYVLSTNDELVVTLRGQENSTFRVRVDRDGTVVLPKLNPILAAGRRFGDFRADLEAQVAQTFVSTKVFVAPGSLHQATILVSGEVRSPGARVVGGLASPLDVILLSGGIKKTGSLRSVRVSGSGGSRIVDLYSVIAQGGFSGLGGLRDGDTVYVPPITATAAVTGGVTRPGIFELPHGSSGVSAASLLQLAGGVEIAGSYRLAKVSIQSNGSLSLVPAVETALVHSGEVLVVLAEHGGTVGRVSLRGAVAGAGVYPLSTNASAGDLFHSATDLSYDGYAPFALILRRDPVTNAVTIVPFSIAGAIRRTGNIFLQSEDLVYVLTRAQVAALAGAVTRNANTPGLTRSETLQFAQTDPRGTQQPSTIDSSVPSSNAAPSLNAQRETRFEPPTPPAGQELPPGIEPPPEPADADRVDPNEFRQSFGGSGNSARSDNATNFDSPDGNGGTVNGDDPRLRGVAPADSSEAAALAQAQLLAARNGRSGRSRLQRVRSDEEVIAELARLLHVTSDALLRTTADNLVWVLDDVREPGPYVGAPGSSVADMVQAAGGPQQTADLSSIEVTSTLIDQMSGLAHTSRSRYAQRDIQTAMVSVRPLDVIRLRPVYSDREEGVVTVLGQVRYPGVFDITRNEHLSTLLERAGGLSEVAYPYGAIFTRKNAAIAEREGNERSARELENEVPTLILTQGSQGQDLAAAGTYLTRLSHALREMPALGRIVITADPAVLVIKPELDFVLQSGDTLFVPKRPSTVTVSGEVLNPGSFQYRSGLQYSDYVRLAGGATQAADNPRTFVVYPDGSSAPIDAEWLSFGNGGGIPPGSTIVVPRDLRPFNWSVFFKDVTQIASQLAVTAASLSVLSHN